MRARPVTVWIIRPGGGHRCLGCDRPVDRTSALGCKCVDELYAEVRVEYETPAWWRAKYGRRKAPLWRDET